MGSFLDTAESLLLKTWDPAVFSSEVIQQITRRQTAEKSGSDGLKAQSYNLTAKSLTAAYDAGIRTYESYFDMHGFEEHIPTPRSLKEKKELYRYTTDGGYPPYLKHKYPWGTQKFPEDVTAEEIHDPQRLSATSKIVLANQNFLTRAATMLRFAVPDEIRDFVVCDTFAELEANNDKFRKDKVALWGQKNVADRPGRDWYTDAVFAQQSFIGTNPTTIQLASPDWVKKFRSEADRQKKDAVVKLLDDAEAAGTLYIQDYSFIREAIGAETVDEPLSVESGLFGEGDRYAPCAVALYNLDAEGRLHPLAIVTDYRGSMDSSVVIFNKRRSPSDAGVESSDWPWRYAKTCVQVSDWMLHEVAVHLTNTHLVEEAIIVATHRNIPTNHLVYRLLSPHWIRTLSLNAGARDSLVPNVVIPICGLTEDQVKKLVNYAFYNFKWEDNYVPNDLRNRGFPPELLGDERCNCDKKCTTEPGKPCQQGCGDQCHQPCDKRFHNYAYARNIKLVWETIRIFVKQYLAFGGHDGGYNSDADVVNDKFIKPWYEEIRSSSGGGLQHFPEIKTLDSLIDVITMCIHIAAPQHTAVNYLQEYYQSFVVSKPPALCQPMPTTIEELRKYTEADLIKALPVNRPREWLIASHVANLLSMKVADDLNLITYATTVYNAAGWKKDSDPREGAVEAAAEEFCTRLWKLGDTYDIRDPNKTTKKGIFTLHSEQLDDQDTPYRVMDPVSTAVSILI